MVCRMNFGAELEYRAFLCGNARTKARPEDPHVAGVELGYVRLPRPRTLREAEADPRIKSAIEAMQKKCAEHAGLT